MRICYSCKKEKVFSDFYKGKCYKDGFDIYCKDCARKRRNENRLNPKGNRHSKRNPDSNEFRCPKCKIYKNKNDFYIDKTFRSPSGYSTYCKDCDNKRHATEECKESKRNYYHNVIKIDEERFLSERKRKLNVWKKYKNTLKWKINKAKVGHGRRQGFKKTKNNLTSNDVQFLLKFQNNKCACCKRTFSDDLKYELDHILPLSKGGDFTLKNIQLLCKSCNCIKGNKMIKYRNEINFVRGGLNG